MVIFFDTEFTGLVPNTTLISIGMVSEAGQKFYGEFTDYNRELAVNEWLMDNVFGSTIRDISGNFVPQVFDKMCDHMGIKANQKLLAHPGEFLSYSCKHDGNVIAVGDSNYICGALYGWLSAFDTVELVGDVCHYDMTLLCNLFGGAMNLPKNVCPACYDICQDICVRKQIGDGMAESWFADLSYMPDAFDCSRERLMEFWNLPPVEGAKHNALHDAEMTEAIYKYMRREPLPILLKGDS